jgi:hypothetical protein
MQDCDEFRRIMEAPTRLDTVLWSFDLSLAIGLPDFDASFTEPMAALRLLPLRG